MMKPVLFNTDMVRAILQGRKCVTRRIIPWDKVNAVLNSPARKNNPDVLDEVFVRKLCDCRYAVGDVLYIREKWAVDALPMAPGQDATIYAANFTEQELQEMKVRKFRWKPSIHMPRDKARIFLRVTEVRPERLQDITAEEAMLEGIEVNPADLKGESREHYYRACFAALWDTTIRPEEKYKFGWDANPWVWVIHYERIEKPEVE